MDANVLISQFDRLKTSLVFDLNNDLKNNPERIMFSKSYYHVEQNNPDEIYSIYGTENGVVMVDSFFVGTTAFDVSSLPIDILIKIKKEVEDYANLKLIRSRM